MVTEQQVPSKAALLEALRSSERDVLARLRSLPAAALDQGRYENGWNARQILAHVASIEWSYPRLIDLAKQTPPSAANATPAAARQAGGQESSSTRTGTVRGGIYDYNQRQIEKRAGASVEELLAEFQKNRAATIAAVEEVDEALLATPIQSAGGISGALASVIDRIAVQHILAHVNDIVGAN